LEKAGIKTSQKVKERSHTLDPITCPQCSTINPPGKRFCGQCGSTLTEEAEIQVFDSAETIRQLLIKNPPAQTAFLEILTQLKT
jgi:predicted amidophosphoribosyltransferase